MAERVLRLPIRARKDLARSFTAEGRSLWSRIEHHLAQTMDRMITHGHITRSPMWPTSRTRSS